MAPDFGARCCGELAGKMPDPTRGTIDQYLAFEQQPTLTQCVQRGKARDRQRRRFGIADLISERLGVLRGIWNSIVQWVPASAVNRCRSLFHYRSTCSSGWPHCLQVKLRCYPDITVRWADFPWNELKPGR